MRHVDAWLFAPGDRRRLAGVRIGLCALLAVRLSRSLYLGLAGQPASLYRPRSFMHLFAAMPSRGVVLAVQIVGVAAAVLAVLGWRARLTLPVAWTAGLFLNGMATSVGKVVHNDVLLILAMVPLLVAPVDEAWVLGQHRPIQSESVRFGWPVRMSMVIVAGGYFFTGLAKLVFSGPAWILSDNLRWVLYAASAQRATPVGPAVFIADRPLLAHVLAGATIVIEAGFPVVLFRPRLAWLFVPGAVGLHASIWATMHLDYSAWAATAVIVFVPWPWVVDRLRARMPQPSHPTVTILYDRDCGFCRWSMSKILAWDRRHRLRPVALQEPEADRLLAGMPKDLRMASWHLVEPNEAARSGGAAVPWLLRLLPGGRPLAAIAGTFPRTTDRAYRLVARHRDRLGRLLGEQACAVDIPTADPEVRLRGLALGRNCQDTSLDRSPMEAYPGGARDSRNAGDGRHGPSSGGSPEGPAPAASGRRQCAGARRTSRPEDLSRGRPVPPGCTPSPSAHPRAGCRPHPDPADCAVRARTRDARGLARSAVRPVLPP